MTPDFNELDEQEARVSTIRILTRLRRALQDDLDEEDRSLLLTVLDGLESDLVHADKGHLATYEAMGRFRRALQGPGLTLMERAELACPGGFLDQVEAFLL